MPAKTPEEKAVAYVKRQARLIERCLEDPDVAAIIAANEEIVVRLDKLVGRIRDFLAART